MSQEKGTSLEPGPDPVSLLQGGGIIVFSSTSSIIARLLPGPGKFPGLLTLVALLSLVLAFLLISTTDNAAADNEPPANGDWIVDSDIPAIEGEVFELNGNIIVRDGGNLVLLNTEIIFNCETQREFGIEVEAGGRLRIADGDFDPATDDPSVIRAKDPVFPYSFKVHKDTTLKIQNSKIMDCGYRAPGEPAGKGDILGVWVNTDNAEISNTNFTGNYCALFLYKAQGTTITNNVFYGNGYGLYLYQSELNQVDDNRFDSNSIGIFLQLKANSNEFNANEIYNSTETGIYLVDSSFNSFDSTVAKYNNVSLALQDSTENVIRNAVISLNNYGVMFQDSDNNQLVNCYVRNLYRSIYLNRSEDNEIEECQLLPYNDTSDPFLIYLNNGSYGNAFINSELNLSRVFCRLSSLDLAIRLNVVARTSLDEAVKDAGLKILQERVSDSASSTAYLSTAVGGNKPDTDQDGLIRDVVLKHSQISSEQSADNGTNFAIHEYTSTGTVSKDAWELELDIDSSASHTQRFTRKLAHVVVVDAGGEGDFTNLADAVSKLKRDDNVNTIFIHDGVYLETESSELATEDTDGAHIIGQSRDGVIVKPDPSHPEGKYNYHIGIYINGSGHRLENLSFHGWQYGVYIEGSQDVTLENVAFINCSDPTGNANWYGVGVYGSSDCRFVELYVDSCDIGAFVSNTHDSNFENCSFRWNSQKNLMLVEGSSDNRITGCFFEYSVCGVYLSEESSDNIFSENWYQNNLYGIYLDSGNHNQFREETVFFQDPFDIFQKDRHLSKDISIWKDSTGNLFSYLVLATDSNTIHLHSTGTNDLVNPLSNIQFNFSAGKILAGFYPPVVVKSANDMASPVPGVEIKIVNNGETIYASGGFGGSDSVTDSQGSIPKVAIYRAEYTPLGEVNYQTQVHLTKGEWNTTFSGQITNSSQIAFYHNAPPTVSIKRLSTVSDIDQIHNSFSKGNTLYLRAEAQDEGAGEVVEYNWTMERPDGSEVVLGNNHTLMFSLDSTNLSKFFGYGEFRITVKVKDQLGSWSQPDTRSLEITKTESGESGSVSLALVFGVLAFALFVMFGVLYFVLYNKLKYVTRVEDMFVIYEDGRQIHHETRRMKPVFESELISSMFSAVQDFIGDSFKDEKGVLGRLDYGDLQIIIERGEHLFTAVVLTGDVPDSLRNELKELVKKVEITYHEPVKKWSGDPSEFRGIRDVIQEEFYEKLENRNVLSFVKDHLDKKKKAKALEKKLNEREAAPMKAAVAKDPVEDEKSEMEYGPGEDEEKKE